MEKISLENKSKKRKRNTTEEQYEIYLSEMENDYVFRTGSINPTLDENYLPKKWEDISKKLNSVVNGPQLSVDEWKKRLKDWKNCTRAKYRKLYEDRKKTGGGPYPDIKLTPLEERGLTVWGRVAVTGCSVQIEGGLSIPNQENKPTLQPESSDQDFRVANASTNKAATSSASVHDFFESGMETEFLEENFYDDTDIVFLGNISNALEKEQTLNSFSPIKKSTKRKEKKKMPINKLGEELLSEYKENNNILANISKFLENASNTYDQVQRKKLDIEERVQLKKLNMEERRLDIEEKRLQFEIQKYKFEHAEFYFEN